jgi:AcrR family transcriptional regulator
VTGGAGRAEGRGNENTRAALLDAAVARFGRDGLRSTSVAEIARDVGVSPTTTYIYFATKADLFLAAVDHDADAVIREGLLAVDDPTDPRSWRGVLFMALLRSIEQHPLARRVLEGREPEVTARSTGRNTRSPGTWRGSGGSSPSAAGSRSPSTAAR